MAPDSKSPTGIGVDQFGSPVIDPTANVIALVEVETRHAKEIRELENKRQDELRIAEGRRQDELRKAEQVHQEKIAALKLGADKQMSDVLTVQVKTTSELISKQLEKETKSLSDQIGAQATQQQALLSTLSDRIGRLEQVSWTAGGKTSVSDPATAESLMRMSNSISSLSTMTSDAMTKIASTTSEAIAKLSMKNATYSGEARGKQESSATMYAVIMALVAVAAVVSPLIAALIHH